jgi:hypothetical protein
MEIRLNNKYLISSDAYGLSLGRIKKRQKDGEEYTQNFAHFSKIEEAFTRILEQDIKDSEATEICQLLAELKASKEMVANHFAEQSAVVDHVDIGFEVVKYVGE